MPLKTIEIDTGPQPRAAILLTPIFLGHGRHDDVVPVGRASASRDALQALGYTVAWHEYPMAHAVCPEEVTDLNRWLLEVLAPV